MCIRSSGPRTLVWCRRSGAATFEDQCAARACSRAGTFEVSWDGGFMMSSQELETAARLKLNLVVIILNDSAYGMIKWNQQAMGFDSFGLDCGNPDFVAYARSYGAHGHLISSDEHFQQTLDECLTTDGVHVIELPVDYSLNHEILNVLRKEKTCRL